MGDVGEATSLVALFVTIKYALLHSTPTDCDPTKLGNVTQALGKLVLLCPQCYTWPKPAVQDISIDNQAGSMSWCGQKKRSQGVTTR